MITISICLAYYDSPKLLNNFLTRLYNHTDFLKFKKNIELIISNDGTPKNKMQNTIDVINKFDYKPRHIWCDTGPLVPGVKEKGFGGTVERFVCHNLNYAAEYVSNADVFCTAMIGQVFCENYFSRLLSYHIKYDNIILLPKRYDLIANNYHDELYDKPFNELKKYPFQPSGGWPDCSIRRKYILEVGGWDEEYQFIAPTDMDFGSRMCGKLDNGMPSEWLYPNKGPYNNYGLNFMQPDDNSFISLVCNEYKDHMGKSEREKSYNYGIDIYLKKWGIIKRNENKQPMNFEILS